MIEETTRKGITFTVHGPPVAKQRAKAARRGNYVTMYTPKETVSFENLVKLSFRQQIGADFEMFTGPVLMEVKAYKLRPKGHYGTGRNAGVLKASAPEHNITKPDASNVLKACEDALNGIAYTDDCHIIKAVSSKHYGTPRTEIEIWPAARGQG